MVLDTLGKPVTVESLIASVRPTEKGILSKDVADMLCRNNEPYRVFRRDFY